MTNRTRDRLTPKQEAFVEAYLRLQNGRQAYKEVYDKTGKMSDESADANAARAIRLDKVANALAIRKEQLRLLHPGGTVEELCEAWANEAFFDPADLYDEEGKLKPVKNLPKNVRKALQVGDFTENGEIKYRLPDKQKAKIELGKRIGFYPDPKLNIPGLGEGLSTIAEALDAIVADIPGDLTDPGPEFTKVDKSRWEQPQPQVKK